MKRFDYFLLAGFILCVLALLGVILIAPAIEPTAIPFWLVVYVNTALFCLFCVCAVGGLRLMWWLHRTYRRRRPWR